MPKISPIWKILSVNNKNVCIKNGNSRYYNTCNNLPLRRRSLSLEHLSSSLENLQAKYMYDTSNCVYSSLNSGYGKLYQQYNPNKHTNVARYSQRLCDCHSCAVDNFTQTSPSLWKGNAPFTPKVSVDLRSKLLVYS